MQSFNRFTLIKKGSVSGHAHAYMSKQMQNITGEK
jgi:hypothetical protein